VNLRCFSLFLRSIAVVADCESRLMATALIS
jgi:hypothetical protein